MDDQTLPVRLLGTLVVILRFLSQKTDYCFDVFDKFKGRSFSFLHDFAIIKK